MTWHLQVLRSPCVHLSNDPAGSRLYIYITRTAPPSRGSQCHEGNQMSRIVIFYKLQFGVCVFLIFKSTHTSLVFLCIPGKYFNGSLLKNAARIHFDVIALL